MGLTLIEAAKRETGDVYRRGVIEMFAASSDIMASLPFVTIAGNAYHYNLEQALPGVAFRGVNEAYTPSTGVLNPKTEALTIAGGDLDVDVFIVQTMGGQDQRSAQEAMKVKSLSAAWTLKFIKGDSSTEPREFDGLQSRFAGTQLIDAGATAGGDVLSLSKMDELLDAVNNPTHLIMSRAMRRFFRAARSSATVGGNIQQEIDDFGKPVLTYAGLPILTGYEASDNDAILPFDEASPGGGAAASTSIYAVNFSEMGIIGLQSGEMQVRDLGELQTAPQFRTRVEWYVAIAVLNGRAGARLRGIKTGAIVA